MRNTHHKFHSNGVGMQEFNNQKFTSLKSDSRFRKTFNSTADNAMSPEVTDYDKREFKKSSALEFMNSS